MLQMTFVNCIAILSNYFGGEVKFVLVAKVNKSLTRIFWEKISECFRINTNASKTWLKYRPYPETFDSAIFKSVQDKLVKLGHKKIILFSVD